MEFTEEHANQLLSKEWLTKSNPSTATPYLIKFRSFEADSSCCLLATDTKSVWTEVLTDKQLARRWRFLNQHAPELMSLLAEDAWRKKTVQLLSAAHTIGGFADLSFEIVESQFAEFGLELECEAFKWRWELTFLGHKLSSEIISKHLIFPLISLNHLSFSSSESTGELSESDLEKAIDKLGRTARRTAETHIKNALSKPRVATAVRRMTAVFNSAPDLPPVTSTAEKPLLEVQQIEPETTNSHTQGDDGTPNPVPERHSEKHERNQTTTSDNKRVQPDSATESDEPEPMNISRHNSIDATGSPIQSIVPKESMTVPRPSQRAQTPNAPADDSEVSPQRPLKKAKPEASSSDDDSDSKQTRSRSTGVAKTRGTRQPIKRGAKRF